LLFWAYLVCTVADVFGILFSTFQSELIGRLTATNGGTVLRRFALIPVKGSAAAGKKDSGMPHVENDRIVESTNEARAGVTGQHVNYVLLISTVAVIVLLAVAYLVTSS
jgi:hypothetical protein